MTSGFSWQPASDWCLGAVAGAVDTPPAHFPQIFCCGMGAMITKSGSRQCVQFGEYERANAMRSREPAIVFDRVRVLAVRRQEQKVRPCGADRLSHSLTFVTPEIVHHDHIASAQGRNQNAFDIGREDVAIHGAVKDPGRINPVMVQGGDEGGGVPMPEGNRAGQAFAFGCPAPQGCHVCLYPGLIDEDQPRRINAPLMALPPVAAALHIRAVTLVGDQCLFLKLNPQPRRNRQTVSWLTAIPRPASISCSIASVRCGRDCT